MTAEWTPARLGDLTGKRIIVTGATNGVGLGTARALTRAGAHVIMAVRNTELGAQRAKEIGGSTVDRQGRPGRPVVGPRVRRCARWRRRHPDQQRGHAHPGLVRKPSTGSRRRSARICLGPFALTNLIFRRVRSQIINVGSQAHRGGTLRLDDMHLRTNKWTMMGAYARSKLAVMMWGLELDRRLRAANSPVVTQLTHPGWVASNLSSVSDRPVMAPADRVVRRVANVFGNDIDAGAATTPVLHQRADTTGQLRRLSTAGRA